MVHFEESLSKKERYLYCFVVPLHPVVYPPELFINCAELAVQVRPGLPSHNHLSL